MSENVSKEIALTVRKTLVMSGAKSSSKKRGGPSPGPGATVSDFDSQGKGTSTRLPRESEGDLDEDEWMQIVSRKVDRDELAKLVE